MLQRGQNLAVGGQKWETNLKRRNQEIGDQDQSRTCSRIYLGQRHVIVKLDTDKTFIWIVNGQDQTDEHT